MSGDSLRHLSALPEPLMDEDESGELVVREPEWVDSENAGWQDGEGGSMGRKLKSFRGGKFIRNALGRFKSEVSNQATSLIEDYSADEEGRRRLNEHIALRLRSNSVKTIATHAAMQAAPNIISGPSRVMMDWIKSEINHYNATMKDARINQKLDKLTESMDSLMGRMKALPLDQAAARAGERAAEDDREWEAGLAHEDMASNRRGVGGGRRIRTKKKRSKKKRSKKKRTKKLKSRIGRSNKSR